MNNVTDQLKEQWNKKFGIVRLAEHVGYHVDRDESGNCKCMIMSGPDGFLAVTRLSDPGCIAVAGIRLDREWVYAAVVPDWTNDLRRMKDDDVYKAWVWVLKNKQIRRLI